MMWLLLVLLVLLLVASIRRQIIRARRLMTTVTNFERRAAGALSDLDAAVAQMRAKADRAIRLRSAENDINAPSVVTRWYLLRQDYEPRLGRGRVLHVEETLIEGSAQLFPVEDLLRSYRMRQSELPAEVDLIIRALQARMGQRSYSH